MRRTIEDAILPGMRGYRVRRWAEYSVSEARIIVLSELTARGSLRAAAVRSEPDEKTEPPVGAAWCGRDARTLRGERRYRS